MEASIETSGLRVSDVAQLYEINEAAVPAVGSVSREFFDRLLYELADLVLVARQSEIPLGFVLCMRQGVDYGSPNYRWICERYPQFVYVDRVAVAAQSRSAGIGGLLYDRVTTHYGGKSAALLAEVSLEPPNLGSVKFHRRMGFREVGERWDDDGSKGVVFFERAL